MPACWRLGSARAQRVAADHAHAGVIAPWRKRLVWVLASEFTLDRCRNPLGKLLERHHIGTRRADRCDHPGGLGIAEQGVEGHDLQATIVRERAPWTGYEQLAVQV